jgi:outer membrane protein TolC
MANLHNERLALKGEEYVQALIDKDRAVAAFLPTVTLMPTYMRQEKTRIPAAAAFVPPKAFDAPVDASLTVNPLSDTSSVRAAGAVARRERALLLDMKAQVLLDVARTYYQVLRSEAQVNVLTSSVAVQQKRVDDMRNRAAAGIARPLDVSEAEAQLAATRVMLVRSENDVANGRSLLAFLIGARSVGGPLADSLELPEAIGSTGDELRIAWDNRQDLVAADAQVAAAAATLKSAWGRFAPTVSLDLSYYLSRESFPDDIRWVATGTLAQPIFQAGLIRADIRSAMSRLRQAWLQKAFLHRRVAEEIAVALSNLDSSARALDQLSVGAAAAADAFRQADESVQAGTATYLDRLIAQDRMLSANLAATSERFNRKIFYLDLLRAVGLLDTKPVPPETRAGGGTPADKPSADSVVSEGADGAAQGST